MNKSEWIDCFADIEHKRWSDWHEHAYNNWTPINITRWNSQAKTEYKDLPELTKELDRREVHRYWPLIEQIKKESFEKGVEQERTRCVKIVENFGCGDEKYCEYECCHLDIKKEICATCPCIHIHENVFCNKNRCKK